MTEPTEHDERLERDPGDLEWHGEAGAPQPDPDAPDDDETDDAEPSVEPDEQPPADPGQ